MTTMSLPYVTIEQIEFWVEETGVDIRNCQQASNEFIFRRMMELEDMIENDSADYAVATEVFQYLELLLASRS